MRGALAVACVLAGMMAYLVLTLVGWHKDNLGGPYMSIVATLAVVLGVGLASIIDRRPPPPDQDEPPKRRGSR